MTRQYIGARYTLKIYENSLDPSSPDWEANVNYEPLTVVTHNNSAYISKKEVPATVGDPAANPLYWAQFGSYNGQIADLYNKVNQLKDLTTLLGKKIAIVGDSLSVSGTWTDDFISRLTGIATVQNNSIGGRRMTNLDGNWSTLLGSNDFDIIIIELGVNDWNNDVPIERFTNVSPSSSNFEGALVNAYTSLITYYSGAGKLPEIYFLTPTPFCRHTKVNSFGFSVDVYRKVIEGFCSASGCKLICGDRVGLVSNGLSSVPTTLYMSDGLHPDTSFNPILADYVISKLIAGGDNCGSPTDGVLMDYSSYFDTNIINNPIMKMFVESGKVHIMIDGRIPNFDPSTDNGKLLATLPSGAGKIIARVGDPSSAYFNIPAYMYGSNNVFAGSLYIVGDEIRILTDIPTAQGIRIKVDAILPSEALFMPDYNV